MTKEITKSFILQEIQDKFQLREFEAARFLFDETVIPVYDIGSHLGQWEVQRKTVSITSAAAFFFFQVPKTERWLLRAYQVIYGATGAHKGSGLYVDMRPSIADNFIYLDLKIDQDVSYLVNLSSPLAIAPGSRLYYYINSYTTPQDLTIHIDTLVEQIR